MSRTVTSRPHRPTVTVARVSRRSAMAAPKPAFVESVEMAGHIVDSLLLPKVLDVILSRGGRYHIESFRLGEKQDDPSVARITVSADSPEKLDRKSTRLNSSHVAISYAVFCLKKKKKNR